MEISFPLGFNKTKLAKTFYEVMQVNCRTKCQLNIWFFNLYALHVLDLFVIFNQYSTEIFVHRVFSVRLNAVNQNVGLASIPYRLFQVILAFKMIGYKGLFPDSRPEAYFWKLSKGGLMCLVFVSIYHSRSGSSTACYSRIDYHVDVTRTTCSAQYFNSK